MAVSVVDYLLVGGPWDGLQVALSYNANEIQVPKVAHSEEEIENNKSRYGQEYLSDTEFYRYHWDGNMSSGTRVMSFCGVVVGYGE